MQMYLFKIFICLLLFGFVSCMSPNKISIKNDENCSTGHVYSHSLNKCEFLDNSLPITSNFERVTINSNEIKHVIIPFQDLDGINDISTCNTTSVYGGSTNACVCYIGICTVEFSPDCNENSGGFDFTVTDISGATSNISTAEFNIIAPASPPPLNSQQITDNSTAHGITRGHNKKLIYDPKTEYYFAFFLEVSSTNINYYRSSKDLINWGAKARFTNFPSGGTSTMDFILKNDRLIFSYLGQNALSEWKFHMGELLIMPGGILTKNGEVEITDPSVIEYGSLAVDSDGHYWYFGRKSTGGSNQTQPAAMRNPSVFTYAAGWPSPTPLMGNEIAIGTTATKGFALSNNQMAAVSWLEKNGLKGGGRVFFQLYDGQSWQGHFQIGPETPNDLGLDLRPVSALDDDGNIHILLIKLNTIPNPNNLTNRQVQHIMISPPYSISNVKVVDSNILPSSSKITSIQLRIDRRFSPNKIYSTYIVDNSSSSESELFLTRFDGLNWEHTQTSILSRGSKWVYQTTSDIGSSDKGITMVQTGYNGSEVRIVDFSSLIYQPPQCLTPK